MKTSSELWDYACLLYEREGVQAACLQLQDDHGFNVSLLLFCCWRLAHDGFITESVLEQAASIAQSFDQPLITPLRNIRRLMKRKSPNRVNGDNWLAIRTELANVELKAEYLLLSTLAVLCNSPSQSQYGSLNMIVERLYPTAYSSEDNGIEYSLNKLTEHMVNND